MIPYRFALRIAAFQFVASGVALISRRATFFHLDSGGSADLVVDSTGFLLDSGGSVDPVVDSTGFHCMKWLRSGERLRFRLRRLQAAGRRGGSEHAFALVIGGRISVGGPVYEEWRSLNRTTILSRSSMYSPSVPANGYSRARIFGV